MLGIAVRFLAGRYHATPWDRHVNEGAVEWPPAPWRLMRALIATWDLKLNDQVERKVLERILETLASATPEYELPPSTAAHLRHYMPLNERDGRTTKVFDTFVAVSPSTPLYMRWPGVELEGEERAALAQLLSCMAYLGRAESWVEAELMSDEDLERLQTQNKTEGDGFAMRALSEQEMGGADGELCRVLVPLTSAEIAGWRQNALGKVTQRWLDEKREKAAAKGKSAASAKLSKADSARIEGALPANLWEALTCNTGELQQLGWSSVPGARWVTYARPEERRPMRIAPRRGRRAQEGLPQVARFAVAGKAPPRLTDAVIIADRIHRALTKNSDGAPVFAGKENGRPLFDNQHAFILPEANGRHGHITHVTIYAPMGFDDGARRGLERLRAIWSKKSEGLQLVLLGLWRAGDMDAGGEGGELFRESKHWQSRTPFVSTLHRKKKLDEHGVQVGSPEYDLRRLLGSAGYPEPVAVTPLSRAQLGGKPVSWLDFRTLRPREASGGESKKGASRGNSPGAGFCLEFAEAVRGPIALGYGAHFGLGTFYAK